MEWKRTGARDSRGEPKSIKTLNLNDGFNINKWAIGERSPHYTSGKVRLGGFCCTNVGCFPPLISERLGRGYSPKPRLHRAAAALQKGPLAVRCIFNGDYIKGCDVMESIRRLIFCSHSSEDLTCWMVGMCVRGRI